MAAEPLPPLLGRKKLIKVGDESTAGTHATVSLIAANLKNIKCEPGDFFAEGQREPEGNYMGRVASSLGKQMGTLSFEMDVNPGGPFLTLLTGCGYANNTGYKPSSDLSARVTKSFEVYEDGIMTILDGCQGKVSLDIEDGKILVAKFEFSGIWGGVTDVAMPSQAPITAQPYICRGLTLTVASNAIAEVSKATVDMGCEVEERESVAGNSKGIAHFLVTEILPKITIDPEARKVADYDAFGLFLAGGTVALSMIIPGAAHSLTLTAPAVQIAKVSKDIRGKLALHSRELNCCNSSGDDALSLSEN